MRSSLTPVTLSLLFLFACSGSGGGQAIGELGADFVLEGSEPLDGATIYLNDPVAFDFSRTVNLESANLMTVAFSTFDAQGQANSEFVSGQFQIGTRPGDEEPGRRLLFLPSYASNNDFSNGGFRAGTEYLVQLVGGKRQNGTVLRSQGGQGLVRPTTVTFRTVEGTQPYQLFRNPKRGGPKKVGLSVSTAPSLDSVPLGLFGATRPLVRLEFDQALNPRDVNVPVAFDPDPLVRDIEERGRIYLEYKDPELDDPADPEDYTWIPANVVLERNDLAGAEVTLEPVGVLPNNAEVRVIVTAEVEDVSGEHNLATVGFDAVFGTFRTVEAYAQQWNAIAEDFIDVRNVDFGAVFPESLATVGPGYVRAGFDFGGNSTMLSYRPTSSEVVLNTAFTQIVPETGLPFTVNGGVFNFHDVTIPQGVTVRGTGPNPMVWQCSGKFTVAGRLTVNGGDGDRVSTLRGANVAKAGGIGHCGGGSGGLGTPSGSGRDFTGQTGRGPGQAAGRGGRGGNIACNNICYNNTRQNFYAGSGGGSGGGGGGMATQGDPNWIGLAPGFVEGRTPNAEPLFTMAFQQVLGYGGGGCSGGAGTRTQFLAGGEPGDVVFEDARQDNNFWGSGIDLNRRLRITGELTAPTGGGGGGGGGDTCAPDGQPWFTDFSGGGGGAGGGVLIIRALEEIRITSTGYITADGGAGGGGEEAGGCGNAGGGGGGAGGMVILMSAKAIEIEAHGDPAVNRFLFDTPTRPQFASLDYSFGVSADGGICRVGEFVTQFNVGTPIPNKYPVVDGQPMWQPTQYDANPAGGVGGMGIVQLMAPPGDNSLDGTNTILDDNIHFFMPGMMSVDGPSDPANRLVGLEKQQLLGWRGYPDGAGEWRDDFGGLTDDAEGDIRPAPTLLPSTLQVRSRMRSKWIDTGRSQRRSLAGGPDGLARGLDTSGGADVGPVYSFAGTDSSGYVRHVVNGVDSVVPVFDTVVDATAVQDIESQSSHLGAPAYRVELASAVLGEDQRYVQYEAELVNASGQLLQGYAILAHTKDTLWLDARRGPIPAGYAALRVRAKFFEVLVNGTESLGQTYNGVNEAPIPKSNVRIGFAFHRNPGEAAQVGERFPSEEGEFVYDLGDSGLQTWLTGGAPRYVMWDVTFDLQYKPGSAVPPFVSSSTPLPELRFLRLPFRF